MSAVPELIGVLERLAALLREDKGTAHWAVWMEKSRHEIANSDFHGIERLLSAYGGMGSFNDLGTSSEEILRLRHRAYELAAFIKINAEVSGS